MKKIILQVLLFSSVAVFSQEKKFNDMPYLEVQGKADTLVIPNRIYIDVLLLEKDTKGKKSVEALEDDMLNKLKAIGIDVAKNVVMQNMVSNYKKFFLKQTDIQKAKSYSILVTDATTVTKVFIGLEEIGISNAVIDKLEYSEEKKVQLLMNNKAIESAKANAVSFSKPLGQSFGKAIYVNQAKNIAHKSRRDQIMFRGAVAENKESLGSKSYDSYIEFEKIKIASEVVVRFALE
jgi:uncharacterized protein